MKKFSAIVLCVGILVALSVTILKAQEPPRRPMYVGVHLGMIVKNDDFFNETYETKNALAFGGGFGLPVSSQLTLVGNANFIKKSGVPLITTYTFSYQNGIMTRTITQSRNGTASYKEWIFNGGLRYNFYLSPLYHLGLEAGGSYGIISEDVKNANGGFSMHMSATGKFGYYGGVSIERRLEESAFAIVADAQYNAARMTGPYMPDRDFGGFNLEVGARWYFNEKN